MVSWKYVFSSKEFGFRNMSHPMAPILFSLLIVLYLFSGKALSAFQCPSSGPLKTYALVSQQTFWCSFTSVCKWSNFFWIILHLEVHGTSAENLALLHRLHPPIWGLPLRFFHMSMPCCFLPYLGTEFMELVAFLCITELVAKQCFLFCLHWAIKCISGK